MYQKKSFILRDTEGYHTEGELEAKRQISVYTIEVHKQLQYHR